MSSALSIPKSLGRTWTTLNDPRCFPMTFLTIDVERVLLRFLEMSMRMGHVTKPMKPMSEDEYRRLFLSQLVMDSRISGLSESERVDLFDGWLRASVLKFESKGMSKKEGVRLGHPRAIHLGVIRSGLPSRVPYLIQHADVWTYFSALHCIKNENVRQERRVLRALVKNTLGKGVELSDATFLGDEPRYDEETAIDVTALLAMRLFSTFTSARPDDGSGQGTQSKFKEVWSSRPWVDSERADSRIAAGLGDPPVFSNSQPEPTIEQLVVAPNAFTRLGEDAVGVLGAYQQLDSSELMQHLLGLISVRLYQAPLLAARTVRKMFEGSRLELQDAPVVGDLEIYCDFSDGADPHSVNLARRCVSRDLDILRIFLSDRLQLRAMGWVADLLPQETRRRVNDLKAVSARSYYEHLLEIAGTDEYLQHARMKVSNFRDSVSDDQLDADTRATWMNLLDAWEVEGIGPVQQLRMILESARIPGGRAPAQQEQWCWTTGGLNNVPPHRPYALLAGSVKHRSTWRYSPTDQLLVSLLLSSFLRGKMTTGALMGELRFNELINVLGDRFGILIDRPPSDMTNSDTLLTAQRNKANFAQKLRLLGCFEGLSDDSEYQMVKRPR